MTGPPSRSGRARAWRLAARLLTSAIFCLPLVSIWRMPAPWSIRLLMAALVALSAVRPATGVLVLCAALPLALGIEAVTTPPFGAAEISEMLVLAFLAGAALRVVAPAAAVPDRLTRPVLLFAVLVAASGAVNFVVQQTSAASPLAPELWRHVRDGFFGPSRPFVDFHSAVRWIETLMLALWVERVLRRPGVDGRAIVHVWLIGGAAAASFAANRFVDISLRQDHPIAAAIDFFRRLRITALHPDPNAAGSYFAVFAVPALYLGVKRRSAWILAIVCPLVYLALALAGSRAAAAAVVVALCAAFVAPQFRGRRAALTLAALATAAAATIAVWSSTRATQATAEDAFSIRTDLAHVALNMTAEAPVFGVGVGRFSSLSRVFISPGLLAKFPQAGAGENAHNNFLQVLAEMGIAGLGAFAWLIASLFRPSGRVPSQAWSLERIGVAGGVLAFLLTCVLGHPLLIPQVAFACFLAFGLAAGLAPSPALPTSRTWSLVFVAALVAVVVTLPGRITAAWAEAHPPVVVGAGDVAGEIDGVEYRVADSVSMWTLGVKARYINLPVRWRGPASAACRVEVRLDAELADVVSPVSDAWRPVHLIAPAPDRTASSRQLELRVIGGPCVLIVGPPEIR